MKEQHIFVICRGAVVFFSIVISLFGLMNVEAAGIQMYRLYNPNSGEHFFTAGEAEKDYLANIGWTYEGVAWTAPETGSAVYRLYNANGGEHHYTLNVGEKD